MPLSIVYIDGYNFYYGRLRNTSYKWLDVVKLFENSIVRAQLPDTKIVKVKFFTADAMANFSSHGKLGPQMQLRYHRALEALYPDKLQIIKGYHSAETATMPKYIDDNSGGIVDKNDSHKVWRLNEKQTDVNIALHLYRDAQQAIANNLVICSADSDLVPALKMIRMDGFPVRIGIVIPKSPSNPRPPNAQLSKLADWTRSHIRDEELSASQLPNRVPTRKKPIIKPEYW